MIIKSPSNQNREDDKNRKEKKNNLEALRDRLPVRYSMYWTNLTAESSSM